MLYASICIIYGLWIGGLSTTIYNRLINGIKIGPDHKPECNNCGKQISTIYFMPLIGYILLGGKCKHCKIKIPITYTILEFLSAFYITLLGYKIGTLNATFISQSIYGSYIILLAIASLTNKQYNSNMSWLFAVLSILQMSYTNTLPDPITGFITCIIAYLVLKLFTKAYELDTNQKIITILAIITTGHLLSLFIVTFSILSIIIKKLFKQQMRTNIAMTIIFTAILSIMIANYNDTSFLDILIILASR